MSSELRRRYLTLLRQILTREIGGEKQRSYEPLGRLAKLAAGPVRAVLDRGGLEIVYAASDEKRSQGLDWPADAETMIGSRRMENVQELASAVVEDGIPGDLVECGVWRGGASILMRAVLAAYGDTERVIWAADSFHGLPEPDAERFPADAGDQHHTFDALAVSRADVEANFARYGLLDDRVRFLEGWFSDTLPSAPIEQVALLRADGDMYGSTIDILSALHHKVVPGGFVIIDDFGLDPCRRAVHDFRAAHGIEDEIVQIDVTGVYWRRPR